jgi:peptidoglycan/xylan/chitin deacetylase (PgdA/CDA1 family)
MTVCSRWFQALGVAALALAVSTPARAGWVTPAAGPSATGDPEVVLTFDDGPNPQTTPRVLDTLRAHHLHAIFFLVGDRLAPDTPAAHELVARMISEGHIVANHTVSHQQLCAVNAERGAMEIDDAAATISGIAGMKTPWFRSPYGAYCPRLEAMLAERNLTHFYWDIDSQEWRHNNAKRAIAYITASFARLQGRSVLLMHDTKTATVRALPKILDWLDAENKKRAESTRRPIRIVEPSTVAMEMVAPGLIDWLVQAGNAGLDTVAAAAACLP